SDFSAMVDWGDGTPPTHLVFKFSLVFTTQIPLGGTNPGSPLEGTHTYQRAGTYAVTISITGGDTLTATTQAIVADAPLTASPVNLTVFNNKKFSGPVATFTDANPGGQASDYSATITWDDKTTSAGTVTGTGPFSVSGSHTFSAFLGLHQI